MKKKLLTLVLAAAMVMGLGITASAAPTVSGGDLVNAGADGSYSKELTGTATMQVPTIKVTGPATLGDILMNPYQITVSSGDESVNDSIISPVIKVESKSNVPLAVGVSGSATIETGSKITFSTSPLSGDETKNVVFAYLEIANEKEGESGTPDFTAEYNNNSKKGAVTKGIVLSTREAKTDAENPLILPVGTEDTPSAMYFQVKGSLASTPTQPWTEADKFTAKVKFTFAPQVVPAPAD